MFILQKLVPIDSAPALTSAVGHHAQFAIDSANGDTYLNQSGTWSKIRNGDGTAVTPPISGSVTVQNSAGTVTRSLSAVNGIVTLAATDAILANGGGVTVKNSSGTQSTATGVAAVAAGALSGVNLGATVGLAFSGTKITAPVTGSGTTGVTPTIASGSVTGLVLS